MAFHREIDGSGPVRPEGVERLDGRRARRVAEGSSLVASGTLACPRCDAPVLPDPAGMSPAEALACGFCGHRGAVRGFLTLGEPTRPARVVVRVRGFARV